MLLAIDNGNTNVKFALVNDAGHMMHHDQPAELARLIEDFILDQA